MKSYIKQRRSNPAIDRANIKNEGFAEGLEKGLQGACLLMILAMSNINTEHELMDEEAYTGFIRDCEKELNRIFREQYGCNPERLIESEQFEVYDSAESSLYYIEQERKKCGLVPL